MEAQDQGELFDLYTEAGVPLGVRKARGLVHRDGDWHRSVHVWVWGILDGAPHLVLQRRSARKDTWPRAIDVAVTGHARAGEDLAATLREAEEEIGLAVRLGDLQRLGLRRRRDVRPGVIDNELQEIFARVAPAEIAALAPSPAELESILALPLVEAQGVLAGCGAATARRLAEDPAGPRFVEERISAADLVPAPDGYYGKAYASLAALISGEIPAPWEIG